MSKLIFVTGGARSGKSRWAAELLRAEPSKAFVATAMPSDDEMKERIARHRAERGDAFDTFEEPVALGDLIERLSSEYAWILLDCVTLWLNNLILHHAGELGAVEREIAKLLAAIEARPAGGIIVVSNEVGMGIVPDNPLARAYRDLAGRVNQDLASRSDEVVWLVSGIPLWVKGRREEGVVYGE